MRVTWLAALLLLFGTAQARTIGFEVVQVPVAGDRPLTVGVWYPAEAPETEQRLGLTRQSVATGAPISARQAPLVVMSHGTGGSFADHHDTARALAQAGFVAAALSHTGDTHDDRSRAARIGERPAQLGKVIDYMLTEWPQRTAIDPRQVGVFGFSSGGFTALVAAGGEPDLTRISTHCVEHPRYFDCGVIRQFGSSAPTELRPRAHDSRIRAAVIVAPALGFTFGREGLARVDVPVQLWRASADTILPHPLYAEAVRAALPRAPDYREVEGAGHFDFLSACSIELAAAAPQICAGTFDRAAFHVRFNADVVAFFQAHLK